MSRCEPLQYEGMESIDSPCSGFVTVDDHGTPCAGFRQCGSQKGTTGLNPKAHGWDVPMELRCATNPSLTNWSGPIWIYPVYFYRPLPYDPVRPWKVCAARLLLTNTVRWPCADPATGPSPVPHVCPWKVCAARALDMRSPWALPMGAERELSVHWPFDRGLRCAPTRPFQLIGLAGPRRQVVLGVVHGRLQRHHEEDAVRRGWAARAPHLARAARQRHGLGAGQTRTRGHAFS